MSPTQIGDRLLSWAVDLDENAGAQAERCSRLPFVHSHVALMPDAHFGMGATVGSVIPTKGAVIPSAVGVDIGCGMIAARLIVPAAPYHDNLLTAADLPDDLSEMHRAIALAVPAGVGAGHNHFNNAVNTPTPTSAWDHYGTADLMQRAIKQMGSLGSGNHFVELSLDEDDNVWLVLHSGSRGVGNMLARHHIDKAKGAMKQYFIELEDPDLAYVVEGTEPFNEYISDMLWAQDYAMLNRQTMLTAAVEAINSVLTFEVSTEQVINCHHNFTQKERHGNHNLWITRKGAIQAREGDLGVIPGSMGDRSYIVSGRGNAASFCSCSHGAGRRLGRKQAKRELTEESLAALMDGVAWNGDTAALLDEHPLAYKNIDEVMAAQADLVTPIHTLRQVLNYKGTS